MERENLFTIGQFAALHRINKKTLMWYDEIGLLKPAAVRENGYRCYTYQQSPQLETILLLRELDMSLAEIGDFLQNRSAEALLRLLRGKRGEIDGKIAALRRVRTALARQEAAYAALQHADLSRIELTAREAETLFLVRPAGARSMEDEIGQIVAALRERGVPNLHATVCGSFLSADKLYRAAFDDYDGLFFCAPPGAPRNGAHEKPRGDYLLAYCKGSWDKLPQRYREILSYAKAHGLRLTGYAYETCVNEMTQGSIEDYITRIEIPVAPRRRVPAG